MPGSGFMIRAINFPFSDQRITDVFMIGDLQAQTFSQILESVAIRAVT